MPPGLVSSRVAVCNYCANACFLLPPITSTKVLGQAFWSGNGYNMDMSLLTYVPAFAIIESKILLKGDENTIYGRWSV